MRLRRRARRLVGLVAALALAAGIVALAASPAAAHATLVATSPSHGSELDQPPDEIRLRFSERVTVGPDGVRLRDTDGTDVGAGPAAVAADDPTAVVLPVPPDLDDGGYVVSFRVVSADSHPVSGAFTFGVGTVAGAVDPAAVAADDPVVAAAFAVARWAGYAGLALLAGGLSGFVLWWPGGWGHRRARRLVAAGWLASLGGAAAVLLLQGPYAAGRSLAGVTDPALLSATLDTDYGRYAAARLAVVLAAAPLVFARLRPRRARARGAGAVAVGLALPLTWLGTGHANTTDLAWDKLAAAAHLVAMSTWFGGLALLAVCLLPRASTLPAEQVGPALRRFSLLATAAVATLLVTGVYVAWRQVGTPDALVGTAYGRLLAFKLGAMGVLLWLGALSRSVVQRRYAHHVPAGAGDGAGTVSRSARRAARAALRDERTARTQLGQSVRLEAGTAVAVLAVASVLVATPPGVVVAAGEALGTARTEPVLAEAWVDDRQGVVQVLVDPAWAGDNRVVVQVVDAAGGPWDVPEVRAAFALPGSDLPPLPVELVETAPGTHTAATATLPAAGDWVLEVTVRTSEIDITTVDFEVPVV